MRRPLRWLGLLALAASLVSNGCSFLFVQGPPPPPLPPTDCTSSSHLPGVDALIATLIGLAEIGIGVSVLHDIGAPPSGTTVKHVIDLGVLPISAALLFGGSAWYGFDELADCRTQVAAAARPPKDPSRSLQPAVQRP
jgi:hypothetical protein